MFQPQPAAQQRRHRRLPSGTMVSYAEVKNYLSKREIPQLFESLMAGLMYHRPENHIGYLQTCLDEVKSNSETKVHWSTFVNKKRKSKEILPPLTPKKQDSFSSSWSDNSRQSTPLPPISARTRTRTSPDQQDLRNTYILYHNPPPILAKPKVPVVSVLGGLGSRIDELCEKVVGRLRGVVHISTCSMLKTRMTIEGFYRVTSVPACAVVDSVLQAMSMVQSASALLVAGFPRNRGDIEEYRSRRVRMDGVVLVDFEEDSLRHFLNSEVSSGALRVSDIETELDRYKQDIISVAEYYDEKELLTVVMGDQDTDEMVEDMVIAVDKIIETRKDMVEDDSLPDSKGHDCSTESPCKALVPSPNSLERPSTVEIREATEEDIRSIEAESRNSKKEDEDGETEETSRIGVNDEVVQDESKAPEDGPKEAGDIPVKEEIAQSVSNEEDSQKEGQTSENGSRQVEDEPSEDTVSQSGSPNGDLGQNSKADEGSDAEPDIVKEASTCDVSLANLERGKSETDSTEVIEAEQPPRIPILFAFENIKTDCEDLKELIVNEIGMCYINFFELIRNDGAENDRLGSDESLRLLQSVLQQDSVSYSSGFFISDFPFDFLKESRFDEILKLGEVSFVCKVKEKSFETEVNEKPQPEEVFFESPMSEKVRIIFVTDSNIMEELKSSLQEVVSNRETRAENSTEKPCDAEDNSKTEGEGQDSNLEKQSAVIDNEENVGTGDQSEGDSGDKNEALPASDKEADGSKNDNPEDMNNSQNGDIKNEQDEDVDNSKNDKNGILENDEIAATNVKAEEEVNQDSLTTDKTSRDDNEDSTCQDIDDLVTDDTLNEKTRTQENEDVDPKETGSEASISQITEEGTVPVAVSKEKAVLERQQNLDLETTSASESSTQLGKDHEPDNENDEKDGNEATSKAKSPLIRQGTFLSTHGTLQEAEFETEETSQGVSETAQEGDAAANADEELQGESKEAVESTEAADLGPANEVSQDSPSAEEKKDTASDEERLDEPAEDAHKNDDKSPQNGDSTDNDEPNEANADQTETHNPEGETVMADSEKDQDENKNEENPEIDNQASTENPVEETISNAANECDKSASDVQEDKKSDLENEETEAKHENEEENAADQEVDDRDSDKKDDEISTKSEDVPENVQEESAGDEGGSQQEVEGEKNEEDENGATTEDDSSKKEENSKEGEENGELSNDAKASTDDTESEGNSQEEVSVKEAENAVKDDKSEVADDVNEESADKPDREEHVTTVHEEAAENKDVAETAVLKSMDNDSDSNDENGDKSLTIETQAEVHAPDSKSPPLVQDSVETNTDSNNSTASQVANTVPESVDASIDKENNNEEQRDSIDDNRTALEKELTFENTDESQVTSSNEITIRNETYSGKHQERNGSGILGDSRQEDQPDAEQQERSSSSSRGEL